MKKPSADSAYRRKHWVLSKYPRKDSDDALIPEEKRGSDNIRTTGRTTPAQLKALSDEYEAQLERLCGTTEQVALTTEILALCSGMDVEQLSKFKQLLVEIVAARTQVSSDSIHNNALKNQ
jgi:hypothetical protein